MHGLKFDKKSNKNSQVAFFHTFWTKLICVICESLFCHAQKRSLKNIEKSLKGLWKVLEFGTCKSVGTMGLAIRNKNFQKDDIYATRHRCPMGFLDSATFRQIVR